MMITLMVFNLINLVPLILSQSSNVSLNLNLTLVLWLTNIMIVMKKNNILFMNMTPSNSPIIIISVINLIELNSLIFQIVSLTMRLSINMMLGHIIIHLINNCSLTIIYMTIELFIILIQTYIFTMLNLLNLNNNM